MAYREYIGSRYVPIFGRKNEDSIQWDNTGTYEPLTIVLYQGNSYTSRQFVPAGIDITNGEYWAQTGIYNAQFEQYRQEVQQYDSRITQNADDITDIQGDITEINGDITEIQGEFPELREYVDTSLNNFRENEIEPLAERVEGDEMTVKIPLINGSCTIVKCGDYSFIVDCGETGDGTEISRELTALGITKLNAVIVSHFHHDHCNGLSELLAFFDNNTDFYRQMELPTSNPDYTFYNNAVLSLNAFLSEHELKAAVIPEDSMEYEYNDVKLTMYNTDTSNRRTYEDSWANSGSTNLRVASNNNYSLITRIDYFNNSYVDCGDVEGAAQMVNASKMHECSCSKVPHHMGNYMGYYQFFDNLNPDCWIYNIYNNNRASIPDIYSIWASWHYRYVKYRNLKNVYCNAATDVTVKISNDCIVSRSGYEISQDGLTADSVNPDEGNNMTVYTLIPAEYYNDNPYFLRTVTLQNLVKLSSRIPYIVEGTVSQGSLFLGDSVFMGELNTIFEYWQRAGENLVYRIIGGKTAMQAKINNATGQYYCAEIYNSVNTSTKIGYRLYTEGSNANKYVSLNNTVTTDGTVPSAAQSLLHCKRLAVHIQNSVWIVCDCVPPSNYDHMPTRDNQWYRGFYTSTANPNYMYCVELHGSNIVECVKLNTTNGTFSDIDIDAFMVVD